MILQKIDGNSTWIEPMKNNTEVEMILARRRSLARMKHQGIVPKHQVLDNEISETYRKEIWATHMTFQLVPPDDHLCHLVEKAIQKWKDHCIGVIIGTAQSSPSTYGVNKYHNRSDNSCSSDNHTSTPRSQHTPRYSGRTTTTRGQLCP